MMQSIKVSFDIIDRTSVLGSDNSFISYIHRMLANTGDLGEYSKDKKIDVFLKMLTER